MPDVKWEEINDIIHKCKSTLTIASGIEMMCKKMRLTLSEELDKINEIILNQAEDERETK